MYSTNVCWLKRIPKMRSLNCTVRIISNILLLRSVIQGWDEMWDKNSAWCLGRSRVLDWMAVAVGAGGRHPVTSHINHLATYTSQSCLATVMATLSGDSLTPRDTVPHDIHAYTRTNASPAGKKRAWRKLQ